MKALLTAPLALASLSVPVPSKLPTRPPIERLLLVALALTVALELLLLMLPALTNPTKPPKLPPVSTVLTLPLLLLRVINELVAAS